MSYFYCVYPSGFLSPLTRTHPPFLVTVLAYGYLGHSLLFLLSLFHALYLGFVK
jgi:hypothetical protein